MAAKTYHKTSFTLDHPTLELVDDFCEDARVPVGEDEHAEPGGLLDCVEEPARLADIPGMAEDTRVGDDAQKLVAHAPGEVPRAAASPPLAEQPATSGVFGRARVGGVDQDIRVDDEHSAAIHRPIECFPVGDVHESAAAVEGREGGQFGALPA